MRRAIGVATLLLAASFAHAQSPAPLPTCTAEALADAVEATDDAVDARRPPSFPAARYAEGARPESARGMRVQMRVDATGHVTCLQVVTDSWNPEFVHTPERMQVLAQLATLRYTPFDKDGTAAPARFTEYVGDEDIPSVHRPMPEGPLVKARIRLERTACFGTCPTYVVELRGNGTGIYKGEGFVDVAGEHRFAIQPNVVAELLAKAKAIDFWSLRAQYEGRITDFPSTLVTIEAGGASHTVNDYMGLMDGMPQAMVDLESAIDAAAGVSQWITLSNGAIDALVAENFAFDSRDGAALLMRAIGNDDEARDEAAIVRLVQLGAPVGAFDRDDLEWGRFFGTPLEGALQERMPRVVDALLAKGALGSRTHPDRSRLDAAFVAAIKGGDFDSVQRIWNYAESQRPKLTFESTFEDSDNRDHKNVAPVTLLLDDGVDRSWDGLRIAQWLVGLGCDPKARDASGKTLLHIAADADDLAMVRWLIELGVDLDAETIDDHETPIEAAFEESVALVLLDAGAKVPPTLAEHAKQMQWPKVLDRLKASD